MKYSTFMWWQERLRVKLAEELFIALQIVPLQVELLHQRADTSLASCESAAYEEGIEIRTGCIQIHRPKNTTVEYLANLAKGL